MIQIIVKHPKRFSERREEFKLGFSPVCRRGTLSLEETGRYCSQASDTVLLTLDSLEVETPRLLGAARLKAAPATFQEGNLTNSPAVSDRGKEARDGVSEGGDGME